MSVRIREHSTGATWIIGERLTLVLRPWWISSHLMTALMVTVRPGARGLYEEGVVRVCLDMLLEILRTLERLAAEFASMWLQGYVNADVRGDVVALHDLNVAVAPRALQVEVVGTLPADVALTDMVLHVPSQLWMIFDLGGRWLVLYVKRFSTDGAFTATSPLAGKLVMAGALQRRCLLLLHRMLMRIRMV